MNISLLGSFYGRSAEERMALQNLISREDQIFKVQPGETHDNNIHVRADQGRFLLLNARLKLIEATNERKSDRNFTATVILGVAIFIKSGVTWGEVFHWLYATF